MKRFLTMLLVAASCVWTACDPPVDKIEEPNPYYEFPLKVQKDGFKAGANGVSVTVTDIEEQNIIFTLNPGDAVASYRVDVYPKALIYNMLLEQAKQQASMDAINKFVEEKIKTTYIIIDPMFKDCDFEREGWAEKFRK